MIKMLPEKDFKASVRYFLTAASVCVLMAGCASAPRTPPEELTPQTPLIWPSPPEPARVTYVRTIRKPDDIGASKGFFRRIADFVLGSKAEGIVKPYGVSVDSAGRLVVADTAFKRLHIFDLRGKEYLSIETAGDEPFSSPIASSSDADGNIYVTDSGLKKVFAFSPKGKFLFGFPAGERPTGIAVNKADKRLYVTDTASHSVGIFDLKGKRLGSFGKWGSAEGQFNYPVDLAIDRNGDVFVVDSMNFRIEIFDHDGRFISQFGRHGDGTGDFGRPKGVALDRDGHVYVADALFDTVQIFDRDGKFLLNFGSLGKTAGAFWLPAGLFVDEGNRIYVSDSYNSRVQIFEYLGQG